VAYRLKLRAQARDEFLEAVDWYLNRSVGTAERFIDGVEAALSSVQENPLKYQVFHRRVRRAFVRDFPYGVFFRVSDETILVIAIAHLARNSKTWMARD